MDGRGAIQVGLVDGHGGKECKGIVLSGNRVSYVYAPVVVRPFSGVRGASLWVAACPGDSRGRVSLQAVSDDVNFSVLTLFSKRGACSQRCCNCRLAVRVDAEWR